MLPVCLIAVWPSFFEITVGRQVLTSCTQLQNRSIDVFEGQQWLQNNARASVCCYNLVAAIIMVKSAQGIHHERNIWLSVAPGLTGEKYPRFSD